MGRTATLRGERDGNVHSLLRYVREARVSVDLYALEEAHILVLKCPGCQKLTTFGKEPSRELYVIPGPTGEQKTSKEHK